MIPKVGETASVTRSITEADVRTFAELVGDYNPVHLSDAFAKKTRFGRCIAHGMWGASLISSVLGTKLPGPGSIYLHQSLDFVSPVYIWDTITARVAVKHVRPEKGVVTLITTCLNQSGGIVLKGEAVMVVEQP